MRIPKNKNQGFYKKRRIKCKIYAYNFMKKRKNIGDKKCTDIKEK